MKIAIVRGDGGVSIADVVPQVVDGVSVDINNDDYVGRIVNDWAGAKPGRVAVSWHRIADSDIPERETGTGREYRRFWTVADGKIVHDMAAARRHFLGKLRAVRGRKLQEADGPFMRALGTGDKKGMAEAEAGRQKLRDLPAEVEARAATADTPDALEACWPDELKD